MGLGYKFCFLTFLFFCSVSFSNAQLCTGSLGDPVVKITFGAGSNPGAPLGAGVTNLTFQNNDCPNDGFYTIRTNTTACFGNSWHTLSSDHTGDPNGYMMVVNATFAPSDFYVQTVTGLCGNTTYEFAAWVLSLDKLANSIKVNITFSIENTDGSVIQTYNTNDIPPTSTPQWNQYGFFFKTPSNVSSVVIRMRNNAPGGNGNDLALDDITFRPCGPKLKSIIVDNSSDSIAFCEGDNKNRTLNAVASSGYTSPVYQWQVSTDMGTSWQDIPGATDTIYIRTPTPKGKYFYRLTVAETGAGQQASCRIASNVVIINVFPFPQITFSSNAPVCQDNNLTLTADINYFSPLPGQFTFTYPESNPTFISKTQTDDPTNNSSHIVQIIKTTAASNGNYLLTSTNSVGCSSQQTINVKINQRPIANYTSSANTCQKSSINFTDKSTSISPMNNWNWTFGDGGSSNTQNPSHTYDSAGSYTIIFYVTDNNGCTSDTLKRVINIDPLPVPDFVLPKVCLKDPFAQFMDASTISDNSQAQFTYLWNFGDPSSPATSSLKNPKHVYSAIGNYSVNLKVTSGKGCIKDTTKVFTINGSIPQAMFSIDNGNPHCSGDSLSITNNSTVNFGQIVKVEVYWDNANNPALKTVDDSPYVGKKYKFDYDPYLNVQSKSFAIRYVVYSGISCVNETSQTVTIEKTPVIQFDSLASVCEETPPFPLTNARETSGATGTGSYNGSGVSNNIFNPKVAGKGSHQVKYTFTSAAGCTSTKSVIINVYPQPSVDAGQNKTIIKGATITLQPTSKGSDLTYLWTPPTYLSNPTDSMPTSTPLADITYKLTVTSSNNCTNSDTVQIKVLNGLYIPNAFTPNHDGRNDTWKLPYLDNYPNTIVRIYNRYGQIVFQSIGASISWDGTFKGVPQPADIYVYIVDLKDGKPVIKGTLTIVR